MSFKRLIAVASTVAMVASGLVAPSAALAAAHAPGTIFRSSPSDQTIWFITNDNSRRAFTSGGAFLTYGFLNFGQVVDGNSDDMGLTAGSFIPPRDGSIFCATSTKGSDVAGECALITGGMKARFTSAAVFAGQGYSFSRAQYGDSSFLANTSNIDNAGAAHRQGALVNVSGTVYLVGTSTLLGIPSVDVFNTWGYSFADVVPANAADNSMTKSGVMCARVPGQLNPSFTGTCDDDDDDDDTSDGSLDGGETSIEDFQVSNAADNDIDEGESEAVVAEIEFDVEDADARLDRADLIFDGTGNDEDKPWNVFDSVSLMNGSDVIASMDSDDEDDWSETDVDDIFRIRLSSIGEVFDEGMSPELTVAVDVASSVDGADTPGNADWTIEVATETGDADGFRFVDGAGLDTFEGDTSTASFSIEEAGGENEFNLTTSTNDPEATALEVEDSEVSEDKTIFIFEVDSDEDSTEDLEVEDFSVNVVVGNPTGGDASVLQNQVIDEVTVMIDGDEFDTDAAATDVDDVIVDGATDSAAYAVDLNDGDFLIEPDEVVEVEVVVRFKALDGTATSYDENTTVSANVASSTFDVVGVDSDEDVADPTDTVSGETHTLATSGMVVVGVSDSAERTFVADDAGEFDQGTFLIVFEVTAFGEDIFIDKTTPAEDNDGSEVTTSASYSVSNPGNNSSVGTLSATGGDFDEVTNSWQVAEGDTAEFTLEVTVTASADSSAEVALQALGYALTDINGNLVYVVPDEPEFKTNSITLLAA